MSLRSILIATTLMVASLTAYAEQVVNIGYQRSSTLLILLKNDGNMDALMKPLGFTVKWHDLDHGLLDAMNSGNLDLYADVSDALMVYAQSTHAPLTWYAREKPSPAAQAIIVAKDSSIRSVADLKGKSVAVAKGSGSHFLLLSALKNAGVAVDEVTVRYLEPAEGEAAFSKREVDAWAVWDPYLATEQLQLDSRVLADGSRGLAGDSRFYAASTAFAKAHPEVLKAVSGLLAQAGSWVKGHKPEAAKNLSNWGSMPLEVAQRVNSRRSFEVFAINQAQLSEQQRIADIYYAAKVIAEPLNLASLPVWAP